jgi:hypothetical protein
MTFGFIQIYTIEKNIIELDGLKIVSEWKILLTPNEEYVNNKINNCYDNFISGIKNINIIDTFRIDFNKIWFVFMHARNKNLIASIKNGVLTIIGDNQKILLTLELPVKYEIEDIAITLKANNNFLNERGLPPF